MDRRGYRPMRLVDDWRQAWRGLTARRGLAGGLLCVLTLGIGLSAALFALADPFLSRPLPYADPDRLVAIHVDRRLDDVFELLDAAHVPTLAEWQSRTDLFRDVGAYGNVRRVRVMTPSSAASVSLREVSPNLLRVLGVGADIGSDWQSQGDAAKRVVLTPRGKPGRLALDAEIVRTTLRTENGTSLHVMASLPHFLFPSEDADYRPDLIESTEFGPVAWTPSGSLGFSALLGIGRLQPGVSAAKAEAALAVGAGRAGLILRVEPLTVYMAKRVRPMALGAVGAGLLITLLCTANVMGLLVARGAYRAPEFAIRQGLGASAADLLVLIALELTTIGAAVALTSLLLADLILVWIGQVIPASYVTLGEPTITVRVVWFTLVLDAIVVAACVIPVWIGARASSTKSISRAQAHDPRSVRSLRFGLVAVQTAIAMTLLVGAVFLARSYANLWLQDTGLSGDVQVVSVSYPKDKPNAVATVRGTLDALRRIPGVAATAAGVTVGLLLDGYEGGGGPRIEVGGRTVLFIPSQVTHDYFSVTGMRVLAGRTLRPTDTGWNAVVVNREFARRFWPALSPREVIGQPVVSDGHAGQVVGVVDNTRDRTLDRKPPPRIYKPIESALMGRVAYVIRPAGRSFHAESVRRAVVAASDDAVIDRLDSISGRLADSVRDRTFATIVLTLFAASALGVTAAGVFALVTFIVARRTREIAVRIALGARPKQVAWAVGRITTIASLSGATVGLAGGVAFVRVLRTFLFGVETNDLPTLAAAVLAFLVLTAAAGAWPTRRALRLDPTAALRVE